MWSRFLRWLHGEPPPASQPDPLALQVARRQRDLRARVRRLPHGREALLRHSASRVGQRLSGR